MLKTCHAGFQFPCNLFSINLNGVKFTMDWHSSRLNSLVQRIRFTTQITIHMNKVFLFILLFAFPALTYAQRIQSGNYSTTGYVKSDGTIQNRNYSTVGYIKPDGRIQNRNYSTIGYIKSDGTIQNNNYSTVGYVKSDGRVQDRNYSTLGYVKDDGRVQNQNYQTLGYARGVRKEWAAVVFFFFEFE